MSKYKILSIVGSAIILQGCVAAAVVGVLGGATVAADKRTVGNKSMTNLLNLKPIMPLINMKASKSTLTCTLLA